MLKSKSRFQLKDFWFPFFHIVSVNPMKAVLIIHAFSGRDSRPAAWRLTQCSHCPSEVPEVLSNYFIADASVSIQQKYSNCKAPSVLDLNNGLWNNQTYFYSLILRALVNLFIARIFRYVILQLFFSFS